jgi:hypothetical protein
MPELKEAKIVVVADEDPDTSYLDQPEFEDRKKAYERGDFNFVGVRAVAEVEIGGVIQEITSGGLWGIESDSGEEYFRDEVGKEEYNELADILNEMGVTDIPDFEDVQLVETV